MNVEANTPLSSHDAGSAIPASATQSPRPARGRRPRTSRRDTPPPAKPTVQDPVLDTLAQHLPLLFGDKPLPLKRGIFEDLLAAFPDALEKDSLKPALGRHVRSTRYLTAVAAGLQRHDLNGQAVEAPTPEQVHEALITVFRRRGSRSREDLRPQLRQRILQAFEASGLSPDEYALRTHNRDEEVNQLTQDALAEAAHRAAREEALLRAFDASGKTVQAFADMYGMPLPDAQRTLERARARLARRTPTDNP